MGILVGIASLGHAQPSNDFIQIFEYGGINWTQGKIFAIGEWAPMDDQFGKPVDTEHALKAAKANLLHIIEAIRISAHTQAAHFFNQRGSIFQEIQRMVDRSTITSREYLSDGSLKVTLEMGIWGSFAQLMLPGEIRQVDMVKPMVPNTMGTLGSSAGPSLDSTSEKSASRQPPGFTGLVLDARETGIKPALVPLIRDESGRGVYGPAFVSREFVVQRGVCLYVKDITGIRAHPRVRYNPLVIKCLPVGGEDTTDLLISDADADRLRSATEHLTFLREGRVIIVLD